MKAVAAVVALFLVGACQPPSASEAGVVGVYDPDLSSMEASEIPSGGGYSIELKEDGSFIRTWETDDGPRSHPGVYSLGDWDSGCVQFEATPDEAPDMSAVGTVCDVVLTLLTPRGDTLVFKLRQ